MFLLVSCSSGPVPIEYGKDACDYCRMTIMEPKFGGEFVTKTGKVYKFDATECMVNYYHAHDVEAKNFTTILVANYIHPDKMMDAKQVVFMQNDKIKSPMGAGLAAFPDESAAKQSFPDGGKVMGWNELLKNFQFDGESGNK